MDETIQDRLKALLEDHYRITVVKVTHVQVQWGSVAVSDRSKPISIEAEGNKEYYQ